MGKLVLISIDENVDNSLTFRLQIFTEGNSQQRIASARGKLPSVKDVHDKYIKWQSLYSSYVLRLNPRLSVAGGTASGFIDELNEAKKQFESSFNEWLQPGYQFSAIREALLENLKDKNEDIRVIFEIDNLELQRLPWHLWQYFFDRYHRAEVALSIDANIYKIENYRRKVTILAVFGKRETIGNVTRINLEKDWDVLEQLAQNNNAILIRLEQPSLEDLYQQFDEHKPHIFFFAGHSYTEKNHLSGFIELNKEEIITIDNLKPRLKQAVKWGLQLAIFNSCDGLGIGRQLAKLHVPNIIVMRESVPDEVAQKFLRCFLEEFVQGKPLNRAVRRGREGITYLEHKFPGATWLPIIFQNSAQVPLTWQQIQGITIDEQLKQTQSVSGNSETETKIHSEKVVPEHPHSSTVVLPSAKVCQNCGVVNLSKSKFCNDCGFNFSTYSTKQLPDTRLVIPTTIATPVLPDVPTQIASLVSSEPHSGVIICPNCNHPNPEDSVHCKDCYTPLPISSEPHSGVIICPNCNHPNPEDSVHCKDCYTPLPISSEPHSGVIICPNCNHPNPEGSVQCEDCYTPLPISSEPHSGVIICPNCNHPNPEGSVQCEACYTPFDGEVLCINPHCSQPHNSRNILFCQTCGSELLLEGRYRVMHQLSSGGFGTTFVVKDIQSETSKILKVLHNNHPKAVELFQREAEVLAQLNHPGIPKVEPNGYFIYFPRKSQEQLHCLVMEKIEGLDLYEYLKRRNNRPIYQELALRWLTEVVTILQQVHQQNFFHRDIKPHNIMLRANGLLALIDFGVAREITSSYITKLDVAEVTGIITVGYTPPEQLNGQAVPQSDFFALGRTFVYLLTGNEPINSRIYNPDTDEINWRKYAPNIFPPLADLLDQMMARSPSQRPKNTQVILERLTEIDKQLYSPQLTNTSKNSNLLTFIKQLFKK